ncbi:MAG: hypothetical protein QOE55_6296 [Acidobacteriaceae bacterium]|nr:hypothetical protein [Acidobacteriaceae bacterium]
MLPADLKAAQFAGYPPQARSLVVAHLESLRQLPLAFLPSLLREVIDYDYKFPAECASIDRELANLSSLSPPQVKDWFQAFSQFSLPPKLQQFDWINQPSQFVEQLSAYLWTTQQLDAFRKAAIVYGDRLRSTIPAETMPTRRLGIAVIGQGVDTYDAPLFRNLRQHGAYFGGVKPGNGLSLLLNAVAARAKAHPVAYGHWYIDGGEPADHSPLLTCVSYGGLEPVRAALLHNIQTELQRPGMGPEELRTHLARLVPSDLGMDKAGDEVLGRFQVKLLTEGSGTQIFSTTFAQWTAREALRRAQPLTVMVRFAPRQRQRPMNELLTRVQGNAELDLAGSVVDADMGAYYNWLNQQRLPGADQSAFLVWFEGHNQALAIGPSIPRGTVSTTVADLSDLLALVVS